MLSEVSGISVAYSCCSHPFSTADHVRAQQKWCPFQKLENKMWRCRAGVGVCGGVFHLSLSLVTTPFRALVFFSSSSRDAFCCWVEEWSGTSVHIVLQACFLFSRVRACVGGVGGWFFASSSCFCIVRVCILKNCCTKRFFVFGSIRVFV